MGTELGTKKGADETGDKGLALGVKNEFTFSWRSQDHRYSQYRYTPLGPREIRVARLRPSSSIHEPLRVFDLSLEVVKLDDEPEYIALSYAWGDNKTLTPLLLLDGQFFLVTRSVIEFLSFCVREREEFTFWMDQFCINQNDIEEKNIQIPLMSKIYLNAVETIIWLGEEDPSCKRAFGFIDELSRIGIDYLDAFSAMKEPNAAAMLAKLKIGENEIALLNIDGYLACSLSSLLQKKWFTRLWAFQECVLSDATELLCGSESCSWEELVTAVMVAYSYIPFTHVKRVRETMVTKIHYFYELPQTMSLYHILVATRGEFLCSDKRDSVYALLGIDASVDRFDFLVDYNASIEQVLVDTARWLIKTTESLELFGALQEQSQLALPLMTAQEPSHETKSLCQGLPSWVPDWTSRNDTKPFAYRINDFRAHDHFMHTKMAANEAGTLRVKGKIIQTVKTVACGLLLLGSLELKPDTKIDLVRDVLQQIIASTEIRFDNSIAINEESKARLMRTLTANCGMPEPQFTLQVDLLETWKALQSVLDGDFGHSFPETPAAVFFFRNMMYYCGNRGLVSLDNEMLALSPSNTEVGDAVCILHGSPLPVVLRSTHNGWIVIGQCYVDNMMRGEAVTWAEDEADEFVLI